MHSTPNSKQFSREQFSRSHTLRDFWLAFTTSILIGAMISLASLSDNSGARRFLGLVMNLGASYGSSVLILHGLLSRFRTGKCRYGWLFVPIVGSTFYAGVVTWHTVKHELTFGNSLGWVLMQGVGRLWDLQAC